MVKQISMETLDRFLNEWHDGSPYLTVHTSGSTGTPKPIRVRKEQMMTSARLTCSFLGLKEGDKALLCMSLDYIAGKMMIVRSLVAGLDLLTVPPSGHPLKEVNTPLRFAAMIPMQVYNSLQVPEEKEKLMQIDHLIIGGGAIDAGLAEELKEFPNHVWSTYGMTETLSHIALRRLNGKEVSPYYTPFESIRLSLSKDGTLVIKAPQLCDESLVTNDIAELLPDGRFRILGRKDNVINSGGVKIQIEQVEELLEQVLSVPFAITAVSHPKFGEAVVLLVEAKQPLAGLQQQIENLLPPYWQPKQIHYVDKIPQTGSGKIDRATTKKLAALL